MLARTLRHPHLVAALRWEGGGEPLDARAIAIAALGMAVPALGGLALGRPDLGFTIGLGAMLLAGGPAPAGTASETPSPASAIIPATLAVVLATLIAGRPWTDAAMIALAGGAAAISGYSRPIGVAAIRFIVYLVLSVSLIDAATDHRGAVALVFGLGALWNVAIRLLLARRRPATSPVAATRIVTPAQRGAHWRRTMRTLAGWQFPIRLVLGLAIASVLRQLWPAHHYGWIVLTVALLTQRPREALPVKTIQRAAGTAAGVALTWAILMAIVAPAGLALMICVLATGAALARPRNYLAYAVLATPVILLVLDLGKPLVPALLVDRLVATLIAAAIVVAANLLLARWMPREAATG
ncbi:FUSC family protein [Sphingomonas sp. RT2P30]|uniref:FUSC family protein n=1 Tax=Parasphingomonas halimpatiens TaxID=3096162 RepID=UPI002FC71146